MHVRTQEQPGLPIHMMGSGSSGSSQLVGRVPPVPQAQDGIAEQETPRVSAVKPHRRLTKARSAPGGGGGEDHHPPHQNILEEQIQMTTQQPVSLVEATGAGDASGQKEDWHQGD